MIDGDADQARRPAAQQPPRVRASVSEPAGGDLRAGATHPFVGTPYAERYVIAADNLRRRQLKSALLHGTSRTWREQRRIWPSVAAGLIVVALIAAGIAVVGAFRTEQELQRQQSVSSRTALVLHIDPVAVPAALDRHT